MDNLEEILAILGNTRHRTKTNKTQKHNTTPKTKRMRNMDPIKTEGEPRCWRRISRSSH